MADEIDWLLLTRYFSHTCSAEERRVVVAWALASLDHAVEFERARRIWETSADTPDSWDVSSGWRVLSAALQGAEHGTANHVSTGRARPRVVDGPQVPGMWWGGRSRGAGRRFALGWLGLAAAAILLLAAGVVATGIGRTAHGSTRIQEYATAPRQRLSVTLADGTEFTLAPASTLRVPLDYTAGNRTVSLDGEAMFAVTHDPTHPFVVQTGGAIVRDVGTRFDVRAYTSDAVVRVAVAEGQVGLEPTTGPTAALSASAAVILGGGDIATVANSAVALAHGADVASLTAWTTGTLVFRDIPLSEIVRTLGRWYDIDLRVADPTLVAQRPTLTVHGELPAQVIDGLALLVQARIERRGRTLLLVPSESGR